MIYLNRIISNAFGTKGVLTNENAVLCHTLELPRLNNSQNISCIPAGVYNVVRSTSTRFGDCFRFPSVRGRSGILIHAGNTIKDTRGCILVGLDVNDIGVLHSQMALKRLFERLPNDFIFTIRNI